MIELLKKVVAVGLVASVAVSCGDDEAGDNTVSNDQSDPANEPEDAYVTIGAITSSSGPAASLGLPEEEGLRAFEKADIDCGGKRLRFIFENDQTDPAQAGAAARTLVQNNEVMGIIGPSITANMLAVIPIVLPAETPIVFLTPQPYPSYNDEPYAFSPNYAPFDLQASKAIEFFEEIGIDPGDVAFITGDDATGQSVKEGFASAGVTNVALTPADATDFTPLLRGFQDDDPKHFQIWISRGTPAGITRRQQVEMGFEVPTLLTSAVLGRDFFEAAGPSSEGSYTYVTQALLPADLIGVPEVADQAAAFQEAYRALGKEPLADGGIAAPIAWDAAVSYCDAVRQILEGGEEVTREALRDVLETQVVAAAGGVIERSERDHAGFSPDSYVPVVVQEEQVVPVTASRDSWEVAE